MNQNINPMANFAQNARIDCERTEKRLSSAGISLKMIEDWINGGNSENIFAFTLGFDFSRYFSSTRLHFLVSVQTPMRFLPIMVSSFGNTHWIHADDFQPFPVLNIENSLSFPVGCPSAIWQRYCQGERESLISQLPNTATGTWNENIRKWQSADSSSRTETFLMGWVQYESPAIQRLNSPALIVRTLEDYKPLLQKIEFGWEKGQLTITRTVRYSPDRMPPCCTIIPNSGSLLDWEALVRYFNSFLI